MSEVTIKVSENGPYIVSGEIELSGPDGEPIDTGGKRNVALCRCGGSSTKPFCDGTHSKVGFQGAIRAVRESDS